MKLKFLERFKNRSPDGGLHFRELLDPGKVRLIIFLSLFVTFILVFLIVFSSLMGDRTRRREAASEKAIQDKIHSGLKAPTMEDLVFPEEFLEPSHQFYQLREPKSFWDDEMVQKYWIDIDQIPIRDFSQQNHDLVKNLLDEAP